MQPALEVAADRQITDGEEIVPGLRAIHLRYGKSPGEIVLYFSEKRAVLSGDLIVGEPIGSLTLIAEEKLENPPKAALELRKSSLCPLTQFWLEMVTRFSKMRISG